MIDRLMAVTGRDVSRETVEKLSAYQRLVEGENARQNLVSATTLPHFWDRHILDSAQLIRFAPAGAGSWADIGSGAGLPGVVIACMSDVHVTLIEPRRLRAEFLQRVVRKLALRADVHHGKAESATGTFDVISARAVAGLGSLLDVSRHLSTGKTVCLFPKGKSAQSELAEVRRSWQGSFHVEQSVTDPQSSIIVAQGVRPRPS